MKLSKDIALFVALALTALLTACGRPEQPSAPAAAEVKPAASAPATSAPAAVTTVAASSGPMPNINGNYVMQYVKEVVAIGSRPVGSPGHAKLEQYVLSKLKGVDVEEDKFTAQTPVGKFPVNNI